MVWCVPYGQNENRKSGYGYECRTELTAVSGTGRVVQNSQKSRVRVIPGQNKYSPQKGRKNNNLTGKKKDTIVDAFPITAIGILHTLMHS